jgi:hypothetical protein
MTTEKARISESHEDLLKSSAHVVTLGPNGEPQSSPVWFGLRPGDARVVVVRAEHTTKKYG